MSRSDFLSSIRRHFHYVVQPYHAVPSFRSVGRQTRTTAAWSLWVAGLRSARVRGENRTSQVPGGPSVRVPRSSTPTDPQCPTIFNTRVLPSALPKASASAIEHFGAQSRGPSTRCLRFAARVTQRHARLASGCWSALPGGVRYPQGPIDRFRFSRILLSLASPGARRVDPGSCPPEPPTDPDVRNSRIRLLGEQICYGLQQRAGSRAGGRA